LNPRPALGIGFEKKVARRCIFFGTRLGSSVTVSGVAATAELEWDALRAENIRLRQQAHYYQSLHARAVAKLQDCEGIITALEAKIAELTRRLFGRKSEKRTPDQAAATSPAGTAVGPGGPGASRWDGPAMGAGKRPQLPEQTVLVDRPDGPPSCAQCGRPYARNGTVPSEAEIVWEVHVYRRVFQRQQYEQACACPHPGSPRRVVAAPPPRLIPRGFAQRGKYRGGPAAQIPLLDAAGAVDGGVAGNGRADQPGDLVRHLAASGAALGILSRAVAGGLSGRGAMADG